MTEDMHIDTERTRSALVDLPDGTVHGKGPHLTQVYLSPSHVKAIDPDNMLITGTRGAGKSFWWSALQESGIRSLIYKWSQLHWSNRNINLDERTEVRPGFGAKPAPDDYPDKDVLKRLLRSGKEPRVIWQTVQVWQIASDDHPIRKLQTWKSRLDYVHKNPESIGTLLFNRDTEFDNKGVYFLLLFDALDRCADDWNDMYRLVRGLMQTALDMRSYRRLRVKVFLRPDQVDESKMGNFLGASRVLSSSVELSWPNSELYGLLWHRLVNVEPECGISSYIPNSELKSIQIGMKRLLLVSRRWISRGDVHREIFHKITGPFMGRDRRRGFPYTWIPNHLEDAAGRVSPRSFISALKVAAQDTIDRYDRHEYTLHYDSIMRGIKAASRTRVAEIKEDYPWVDRVLVCLSGMTVPCRFDEIEERWNSEQVLARIRDDVENDLVKLPPRHLERKALGICQELEDLGMFLGIGDGRINIPNVFRVGYGLGRKGGVVR